MKHFFEYPLHARELAMGPWPDAQPADFLPAILDGLPRAAIAPGGLPDCLNHLGDGLFARRRVGEALACYTEAVRLGGNPAERAERRWMAWTMLGRFEQAWQESDRLERLYRARHGAGTHCHMWDGRPLDGRDVFVRTLNGLGDTIQFARYLPLLRGRCRSLTLQAQRRLWPLLKGFAGVDRMVAAWEAPPEDLRYDAEIEVMELPYAFRSTPATLPVEVPYLHVPAERAEAMRKHIPHDGRLRVGLVWASDRRDAARSVPLDFFEPLARNPAIAVYSLQFGPDREDLKALPDLPIVDAMNFGTSILDTAALMMAMDLIITPDTLAAHLAGALGRPVWVLLLHAADWRWMVGREDSPWYPTMRLFRQPAHGDWATVVGRILDALTGNRVDALTEKT